jgi:outer membrane protein assembly factor BamB
MTTPSRIALTVLFSVTLAGCTSGSNPPTCSFDDPAQMPPMPSSAGSGSAWPKFRANAQNTGAVTNVTVSASGPMQMFPAAGDPAKGAFIASPVLNNGEQFIYIGSTDGTMYRLSAANLIQDPSFNLVTSQAITSTAVAALRDGQDAIFVGGVNGYLYGANQTGPQAGYWPFLFSASLSASPALGSSDGTVYVGAANGVFAGICPNGITRFASSTTSTQASIQSSAAIGPDGTVYVGAGDRQLRALQNYGPLKWAFAASAPIVAAPVVEEQGTFVYVADRGGRVFKVNAATGAPVPGFTFEPAVRPISSSPALAGDRLYFGSDDFSLYAISTADGTVQWSVPTGGQIVSSPAVAIPPDGGNPVVVVGSMDGNLYYVEDDGSPDPPYTPVALCPNATDGKACDGEVCSTTECQPNQPQPIESSPAIGADGTVYIGTDSGRVYALR